MADDIYMVNDKKNEIKSNCNQHERSNESAMSDLV